MTWPYPAPVDDGGGAHLVAGTPLPDLALATTDGQIVNPSAIPGRAVIFVYPWTGRPGWPNPPDWDAIPGAHGSTPEAEGFRDLYAKFAAQGVKVYGLSGQDCVHQRELSQRLKLPFPLLSDEALAFAAALRLPRFDAGGTTYLKRLTILTDGGRISRTIYPVHPPDVHAAEVLSMLRER